MHPVGLPDPAGAGRHRAGPAERHHAVDHGVGQLADDVFTVDVVPVRAVDQNRIVFQIVGPAGISQGLVLVDGPLVGDLRQIGLCEGAAPQGRQRIGEGHRLQLGAAVEHVPSQDFQRGGGHVKSHQGGAVHKGLLCNFRQGAGEGYIRQLFGIDKQPVAQLGDALANHNVCEIHLEIALIALFIIPRRYTAWVGVSFSGTF